MKIQFWTVGKEHDEYVKSGIDDFTKRISNYFPVSWKIISPPKNSGSMTEDELIKKEGEIVSKLLSATDFLVTLDEKGKTFSSPQLAAFIQTRANESSRQLIFLIGGAYGIDKELMQRGNSSLSLSSFTFPHQLVRLIIAEQVYRACTILRNEKYHHQ